MAGAAQTLRAVNWTLQRLEQLGVVERETYSEYLVSLSQVGAGLVVLISHSDITSRIITPD